MDNELIEEMEREQQLLDRFKKSEGQSELENLMPKGYRMLQKMGYEPREESTKEVHDQEEKQAEYRKHISESSRQKSLEKTLHNMQKIAFAMAGDDEIYTPGEDPRDFNVLWRGYIKVLNDAAKEPAGKSAPKQKAVLEQSDSELDEDQEGGTIKDLREDPELEIFDEMTTSEKISKLNVFLRAEVYYCYYCGIRYKDEEDFYEHCPGINKEDHE
ncbi:Cmg1p KNAG_0F02860 [Huiozyma naganishii CBS 8797]|uniref:DUF4187 domain-containing protein n=1 Tax=Huiozyma naganishii (strain ATCC MYA-139 / BCRC 22969 / CBS 8797 / KCTC 17520 / NBRC 10181 / NCYC 3082 / Yp74L-3) TaxID=1071383 RepID=J7RN14_HUIN7|nr:hypothetical protein KNAG_0F02860 [Kazachstania naganishii CBS 8797]CCK70948.1 hypothetical protein KNAG_0F02860 [Kazachstania naganishii CBS 8797]